MNKVDYPWVSLTDRSNFPCSYCMLEEDERRYSDRSRTSLFI